MGLRDPAPNLSQQVVLVAAAEHARRDLAEALRARGFAVFATPHEAAARDAAGDADLALVDLDDLAGAGGVVAALRTTGIPIVVVSSQGPVEHRVALLEAGVDDYAVKPILADELAARLRAVLRRARPPVRAPGTLRAGTLEVDFVARVATVAGARVPLTPTEWRLLEALVAHPGTVLDHAYLSSAVWGGAQATDARSLRVHISNLRRKLTGAGERLIDTDHGLGYRWCGPPLP